MGFMGLEFTIGLAVATVVFGLICWLAFDVGKTAYQWLKDVTGLEFSNGLSHAHGLNLDNDKYPLSHDWTESQTRWIAAMLSGAYEQVEVYMHTPEGFCPLGIACDLHDDSKWARSSTPGVFDYVEEQGGDFVIEDSYIGLLPESVRVELGLIGDTGVINWENVIGPWPDNVPKFGGLDPDLPADLQLDAIESLANMNDKGYTFEQIAAFIKAFPKAVFE